MGYSKPMPDVRTSGYVSLDTSTDHEPKWLEWRLAKAARNDRLNQPGVLRNARIATGDATIAAPDFACELPHDVNIDVTLNCGRPMAKAGWLRVRIR